MWATVSRGAPVLSTPNIGGYWRFCGGIWRGSDGFRGRTARTSTTSRIVGTIAVILPLITARRIDLVGDRQPGLMSTDRLADDRRRGRRVGLGRDMRGDDD